MTPAENRQSRLDTINAYLDAHSLDGVLLARRDNFSWSTGGAHNHVAQPTAVGCFPILFTRTGPTVIVDNIEGPRIRDEMNWDAVNYEVYPFFSPGGASEAIAKVVGSQKVATDTPFDGVDLLPLAGDFDALRTVCTELDMERARKLAYDAARALEEVCRAVQPGDTEMNLAAAMMCNMKDNNIEPLVALVAADANISKYRHPLPTLNAANEYFMIVVCGERHGIITSHTRIASFGPISDELAAKHRAVATVDAAFIASTRVGVTLGEVFAEGQAAYAEVGFEGEWQKHHQGGIAGYGGREHVATPGDKTVVQANQLYAWNPSITGTKSEDQTLCTEAGMEILRPADSWPQIEVEWKGVKMTRSDILAL